MLYYSSRMRMRIRIVVEDRKRRPPAHENNMCRSCHCLFRFRFRAIIPISRTRGFSTENCLHESLRKILQERQRPAGDNLSTSKPPHFLSTLSKQFLHWNVLFYIVKTISSFLLSSISKSSRQECAVVGDFDDCTLLSGTVTVPDRSVPSSETNSSFIPHLLQVQPSYLLVQRRRPLRWNRVE